MHGGSTDHAPRYPELLATSASDVMFEGSPDLLIEWISDGVTRLLGWSPSELVGLPAADLVEDVRHDDVRQAHAILLSGGHVRTRLPLRTKGEDRRWVEMLAKPVIGATGSVIAIYGSLRDIQREVETEEALRRANRVKDLMFATMPDPIIVLTAVRDDHGSIADFEYADANPAACEYNGMTRDEQIGRRLLELFPNLASTHMLDDYRHVVESGEPMVKDGLTFFNEMYGGAERFYDVRAARLNDGLVVTWRDVTERVDTLRELALGKEHYRLIADNSSDVIVHTRDRHVVWASPSIETFTGIPAEEWVGMDVTNLVHQGDRTVADTGAQSIDRGESPVFRLRAIHPDGTQHWVELHAVTYYDTFGQPDGVITSVRFVDDLVRAEEELTHAAHHDSVTGMLNRPEVLRQLERIHIHPVRTGTDLAIMFCDLDVFKDINDEHGHSAGDDVLRVVAERVSACIRADDLAARIGGDEMLVVLPNVHGLDEAMRLAQKINEAVSAVMTTGEGVEVRTSLSIGVTIARPGESVDEMVQRADRAMYDAKRAGGNRIVATA